MNATPRPGRGRSVALTIGLSALVGLAATFAPAAASAAGTTTVFISPATTTIAPAGSIGGSFTVTLKVNPAVAISGAGAGIDFDKSKLKLTDLAKDATLIANGASYAGFPSTSTKPTFIANANASGEIKTIAWTYTDGASSETAATDHPIFSATFSVIAAGNTTLTPFVNSAGGILDGRIATYGQSITVDSIVNGSVVNPAAATPPTGAITPLGAWLATNNVPVTWGGTAGTNPIGSYDVRYRSAPYKSAAFGAYTTWKASVAATTAAFTTTPGMTYCFSERARDTKGNVSAWTADTCTAAPLDDRSLTKSGKWTAKSGAAYYRSTALTTTAKGAKLTLASVKVKQVALVATTCAKCGVVQVYLGKKLLKTVNLKSATTKNKQLITVAKLPALSSGAFSIVVTSTGKQVTIDGVVLSAN